MHDWLAKYFDENFKLDYTDFTYGTAIDGSTRLFAALSKFFNKYFRPVEPVQ